MHVIENKPSSYKDHPRWMSQNNHVSLLNMNKDVVKYGNITTLWDGKLIAENHVQIIKSTFTSMHPNW